MPDTTSETTLYPESIAAILDQRPLGGQQPSILTSALGAVIDARLVELRANTERYEAAIAAQAAAVVAERAAWAGDAPEIARRTEADAAASRAAVRHEALLAEIAALTALVVR